MEKIKIINEITSIIFKKLQNHSNGAYIFLGNQFEAAFIIDGGTIDNIIIKRFGNVGKAM